MHRAVLSHLLARRSFQPKSHPSVWYQRLEASRRYKILRIADSGFIVEVGGAETHVNDVEIAEYCEMQVDFA